MKLFRSLIIATITLLTLSCTMERKTISGKIATVGHEPFTYLSIKDEKKVEYKIVGPLQKKLAKEYQGKSVFLTGTVSKKAIGPGFPAEFTVVTINE